MEEFTELLSPHIRRHLQRSDACIDVPNRFAIAHILRIENQLKHIAICLGLFGVGVEDVGHENFPSMLRQCRRIFGDVAHMEEICVDQCVAMVRLLCGQPSKVHGTADGCVETCLGRVIDVLFGGDNGRTNSETIFGVREHQRFAENAIFT